MIIGYKTMTSFIAGALLVGLTALPANASEDVDGAIDQLLYNNPGTSREMVVESADSIAEETGDTREAIIEQFLLEDQENQEERQKALYDSENAELEGPQFHGYSSSASSKPGFVVLPTSYWKGDMYLTPAYTVATNHGHIGIYGDKNWVIEAPGGNWRSGWWWHNQVKVRRGAVLLETTLRQWQQSAAADYAYNHLLGYKYNYSFWSNKEMNPSALNCSQLVWLAYKKATGVDLDGNGGPGVYPYDILKSPYTKVNWVVR